jgi:hypothetical protein
MLVEWGGAAVVTGLPLVAVAAALPQRRRTGPNRTLNSWGSRAVVVLGWLIALAGLAIAVAALRLPAVNLIDRLQGILVAIMAIGLMLFIGTGVVLAADRLRSLGIDDDLAVGTRAPVLFVRPFDYESLVFNAGADVRDTFEGFLGDEIEKRLGPLVALGNPMDRIPPRGAVRSYESDIEWQRTLERLAEMSACILTMPASSPSTAWELTYLKSHGYQRKLFVLTPPAEPDPYVAWNLTPDQWEDRIKIRLFHVTASLYRGHFRDLFRVFRHGQPTRAISPYPWTDWAVMLAEAGYQPATDPGPGAVLTFDGDGQTVVLKQRATKPNQYIIPIHKHLKALGAI